MDKLVFREHLPSLKRFLIPSKECHNGCDQCSMTGDDDEVVQDDRCHAPQFDYLNCTSRCNHMACHSYRRVGTSPPPTSAKGTLCKAVGPSVWVETVYTSVQSCSEEVAEAVRKRCNSPGTLYKRSTVSMKAKIEKFIT